jgi:peptide/nickel transport system substrate-binding protein
MNLLFKKQFGFPFAHAVRMTMGSFGGKAKVIFVVLILIFIGSGTFLLYSVSNAFMVAVPAEGGTLREGVIGLPQFINPLIAVSGPSQDLTELIYSGLLKKTPAGDFVPDLASTMPSVSADNKTYTFIIRDDAVFHDGTPVTADDIEFTIDRALNPALKSPKRVNWEDVTVQKINDKTIQFLLKQSYPFFLENVTLGILPKHIWNNVSHEEFTFSNYNRNPIGSGPYKIDKIRTNSGGIPLSYELEAFKNYSGGKPFLTHITMNFYSNEDKLMEAYRSGSVDAINSLSPLKAKDLEAQGAQVIRTVLPRIFGVFFNASKNAALKQKEVRQALALSLDKPALISTVLNGYGQAINSPLPIQFGGAVNTTVASGTPIEAAAQLLEKNGWKKNDEGVYQKKSDKETMILAIALSTSDVPELKTMAEEISRTWQALGVRVDLKIFETGDLNQNVIRPRNYEALFFGQVVNRDTDLFAFWDSSERTDPGLNIALYNNSVVDKALEEARTLVSKEERLAEYRKVESQIEADVPAIFVYSPEFLYVVPKNLAGMETPHINEPKDRFTGVETWYRETDKVWRVFASQNI